MDVPASVWTGIGSVITAWFLGYKWIVDRRCKSMESIEAIRHTNATKEERLKAEYGITVLEQLRSTVTIIKMVIEAHSKDIQSFKGDIEEIKTYQQSLRLVLEEVLAVAGKISGYYQQTNDRVTTAKLGGEKIINRLKKIETEVEELKNGYLFIKTKK